MAEVVRVLVVEDNLADVELIKEYLPGIRPVRFQFESVPRLSEALDRLKEKAFDLLLIDLGLPDSQGIDTFLKLQKAAPETAAIILTGNDDEETAITAVRNGAQDYLIKGELGGTVIVRAVRYAMERKRTEDALRSERKMLARTEGIAHVGSWSWDIATDTVIWSDELFRIFQRDPREGAPSFAEHPAFYHPDDMVRLKQAVEAAVADGSPYELKLRAIRKDGEIRVCLARGVAELARGGRSVRLFGSLQDVTERNRAEEALEAQRNVMRTLIDNLPDNVFIKDVRGGIILDNLAHRRILGRQELDEVIGKSDKDFFTPALADRYMDDERGIVESGRPLINYEEPVVDPEGRPGWYLTTKVPVRDSHGNIAALVGINRDITERKEKDREQSLAMQVLATLNRQNDIGLLVGDILRLIKESTGFEAVAIRLNEGEDFPYYVVNGFSASFVEAERFLCERDPDRKAHLDSGGNPILECMCGNVLRGRFDPAQPFFTERGSFWTNSTTELLATTTETDRQSRTRNRCNSEGYESMALIPLRSGNEVIGLLQLNDHRRGMFTPDKIKFFEVMGAGIGVAVSRKRAVAAMEYSLREKEGLIQEIHHRVKNNMQVMSSLLNLQSNATANAECREILRDARTRIYAMSLVHEKLYQSKSLARIDFAEYIDFLAGHLFQLCQVNSDQVRLEMDSGKMQLDINSAVPAGLLINELIVNAFKHAFPDGRKGVVKIGQKAGPDGTIEIRVAVDGVGFPEGCDFR